MNTIRLEALESSVVSSDDINPSVAVSDHHLLVKTAPTSFGTFAADAGDLPTRQAKWFRLTNSGSGNVLVSHRVPILSKYFDSSELDVTRDSGSMTLSNPSIWTPNGYSRVLKIEHTADNSAYATIPSPYGLNTSHTISCYFKIESNTTQLQPLGIYKSYGMIDNNHPAVGLRVDPNNDFKIKVGTDPEVVYGPSGSHVVGSWYKVVIDIGINEANVWVSQYNGDPMANYPYTDAWLPPVVNQTVNSVGVGSIAELLGADDYVVAFAAEGVGVQYIENFEIHQASTQSEVLLPGETKEYDCHKSLDEYSVDGSVTGYLRE